MSMLAAELEKVRARDFESTDRWDLTDWLLKCQNMDRREARMRIINDLPEQIRTSRSRDDQNDRLDIRGIVDACLNYSGGLKELMGILRAAENNSDQLQDVENYLENLLQNKHIIAPDPEVEKQIEQLTALIVGMQGFIHTVDLEQVYYSSAPQLNFSDTTWRYPPDPNLAHVVDRILHHLNVAPASRLDIPPILIFVEGLACCTQDKQEQQKLRTWVDNQTVPVWQVKAEVISVLRGQLAEATGHPTRPAEPLSHEPPDEISIRKENVINDVKSGEQLLQHPHPLIKEAYNAIQHSKIVFKGIGDINQSHFYQAIDAFEEIQKCLQQLLLLLNTTGHLKNERNQEQFIIEVRHITIEIKQSISRVREYDVLGSRQRDKYRKDTYSRLEKAYEALCKINWYIHGLELDSE